MGRYFKTAATLSLALSLALPGLALAQAEDQVEVLDTVVVTGKTDGEERYRSTATIWVVDQETIEKTHASSISDLLASTSAGFLSEWTPGQTSINIRGGSSDGQGRDFKSQVMVLINGRRAGTANLSKMSPSEVKRIEIMRGPASVMYGSQAIGGIINLIMKDGRNTEGGLVDTRIGSSGLVQTHGEYATIWGNSGDVATYLGGTWGRKDDYEGGKGAGKQVNTQWRRLGGLGDVNWQLNENNEVQLTVRSDGVYDVGFRGSGANRYAKDDRINQSIDLSWDFNSPDLPIKWRLHNYLVYDEDYLKWSSPVNGISKDYNKRKLYIMGLKFMPTFNLSDTNELLLGVDLEHSKLRSDRERFKLNGDPWHTNPLDINQTETMYAFYAEDVQRLFDDRLTLRGGLRYTKGETSSDHTPNLHNQVLDTVEYSKMTWSMGANFEATDYLFLRVGAATGFRAPTATELSGQVSYLNKPDEVTYGNPNINPENNQQYELGMFLLGQGWYIDLALFRNEIKDRIISKKITNKESMFVNNDGKVKITGLELGSKLDVDHLTDLGDWQLAFGLSGSYNFEMKDEGLKDRNRDEVVRVYKYQGSIYTQFGKGGSVSNPWSARLTGILRGPVFYDTEEKLHSPEFEPDNKFIHRKSSFMVWNLNGELDLSDQWAVYAGLNNIFDKNEHPLFMAIDDGTEYLENPNDGGFGTSMAGREFYLGLKYSF